MAYYPEWPEADIEVATKLWLDEKSGGYIARVLEGRYSRSAIIAKMRRLGYSRNPKTKLVRTQRDKPPSISQLIRERHENGQRPAAIASAIRIPTESVIRRMKRMGLDPERWSIVNHIVHPMWAMDEDNRRIAFQQYLERGLRETRRLNQIADLKEHKEMCQKKKAEEVARIKAEEVELERAALDKANKPYHPTSTTAMEIIKEICAHRKISPAEVKSEARSHYVIRVRHEVCYWLRAKTECSYPKIGSFVGRASHTAAWRSVRKYAATHGLPVPAGDVR